ncbi:putative reverse transcriptase domain-containing protein [Tanacetum coccineum]
MACKSMSQTERQEDKVAENASNKRKWSSTNANTANNQKGTGVSQKATCYECGNQGHYRNDCPKQKNQNHENQTGGTGARRVVYAFGGGETEQDLNNIEDEIDAEKRKLSHMPMVFALKNWRHYFYGTKCTVFTDHKSLQHIHDQKELNMRQRRWLDLVSDYDYEIRYHPGKANIVDDAWSRKERIKPLKVLAIVMTIGLDLPKKILNAQTEAQKLKNLKNKDVGGMIRNDISKAGVGCHVMVT